MDFVTPCEITRVKIGEGSLVRSKRCFRSLLLNFWYGFSGLYCTRN